MDAVAYQNYVNPAGDLQPFTHAIGVGHAAVVDLIAVHADVIGRVKDIDTAEVAAAMDFI